MSSRRRGEVQNFLERAEAVRQQVRQLTEPTHASREVTELQIALEELRTQTDVLAEACLRLEREAAKYRDLYDAAADALVTTDARGIIVDANQPAAALLAFPRDMLPGRLLVAFVARRDTHAFRDGLRAIVNGTGHGSFAARIRPRRGAPCLALLTARVVRSTLRELRGGGEPPPFALHWTLRRDASSILEQKSTFDLVEAAALHLGAPVTIERAQEMKTLLEQLVSLAKEREPLEEVSIVEVVQYAVDRARPAADAREVQLNVHRLDESVRTRATPHQLVWALDRLLALAVEAAVSPGVVHVEVGSYDHHATVRVQVSGARPLGRSDLAVAVATVAFERHGGVLDVPHSGDGELLFEVRLPLISRPTP